MKINWNIIDFYLQAQLDYDDCPSYCKKDIAEFLQTHNMEVFSDESLDFLNNLWNSTWKVAYEFSTGEKVPNIFKVLPQLEEEEVINEQQPLSSGN